MICLGTIVNVVSILTGGIIGLLLKKLLSRRITDTITQGVGLSVVIVGVSGALSAAYTVIEKKLNSDHLLLMIISLAIGGLIGELLSIEDNLDKFARGLEKRFSRSGEASDLAQGFITATLVFCVGSMAIIGSIEDGINRNSDILIAKSALDGITSMVFASTMGVGVLFSAITVGAYQGSITLLAMYIAPYFNELVITQISLIGSVLIMSIGFNMLNITKIKVGNLLPAVFIPILRYVILSLLN